ncbi:MAG: AsmA family protein [Candidatus Rhabdochlamydia oedothoracis]|nr:AsmA family protein [Candidatus Rhabdochlamydia oedothoracis]
MKSFCFGLVKLVVVILIALIIFAFIAKSRLPDIVSNKLSKKIHVPVQIDDIHLNWNRIDIDKITIGNSSGSVLPKAFSCDRLFSIAPFTNYLKRHVIIDQIKIDNVYLGLEFKAPLSTDGNWSKIIDQINTSSTSTFRTVLIRKLILTNIDVDLVYISEGNSVKRLRRIDRIELNDVSSEEGIPANQITSLVIKEMIKHVLQEQNLQNMIKDVIKNPEKGIKRILNPFKKIFNTKVVLKDELIS